MLSDFSTLTLILLSGYLFQSSVLPLRIRSSLHNRYHTLFGAALWGVLIFALTGYMLNDVTVWLESRLELTELFAMLAEGSERVMRAVVCSLAFAATVFASVKLLAFAAGSFKWQWYSKIRLRTVSFAFSRYGSNMLKLVNEAHEKSLPVQITLSNRKIYVGIVSDTVDPESGLLDFRLVPFESGYRHQETLEYVKTTNYRDFHDLFEYFKDHERNYLAHAHGNLPAPSPADEFSARPDDLVFTVRGSGKAIAIPGNELKEMANNFGVVIRWDEVQTITIWDRRLSEYFSLTRPSDNPSSTQTA